MQDYYKGRIKLLYETLLELPVPVVLVLLWLAGGSAAEFMRSGALLVLFTPVSSNVSFENNFWPCAVLQFHYPAPVPL